MGTSLGVSNRAVGTGLYAIWESLSVPENGMNYTPLPLTSFAGSCRGKA